MSASRMRDERHLGKVETLAQEVDADEHVEDAETQVADDLDALHGVDIAVQVADFDARLAQIVGQVLGHLLGQGRDEAALVALDAKAHLRDEIVDLAVQLLDLDGGIHKSRRPDDLLDLLGRVLLLVRARSRAHIDDLPDHRVPLGEGQGTVVECRRQPKPVLHQGNLAGAVALVHAVDLGHGDVRLVDDDERVVGEEIEQAERPLPLLASAEMTRVVLDAGARSGLAHHLHVEVRALAQPLRLEETAALVSSSFTRSSSSASIDTSARFICSCGVT